ncbi:MAG: hypothetical protein DRI34_07580, partial [Deltaproteobacteria bacterium]
PNGPFGAKEVGEGAIMPTIPAIPNALYAATGVRFEKLPVSAERVLAALKGEKLPDEANLGPGFCKPRPPEK